MRSLPQQGRLRGVLAAGLLLGGIGLLVPASAAANDPAGDLPAPLVPFCGNGSLCTNGVLDEAEPPADPCAGKLQGWLFDDACGNNWLADKGFTLGGWLSQGFTWNPDRPANRVNGPVTMNDRANEYQLNQFYLFLEKGIDQSACHWQLGGRVDLLFGTDYYFTQALGLELEQDGTQRWNKDRGPNRTFGPNTGAMYGVAMPQLYAEFGGHDLSIKAGHFYTIIGYEVVTAPDNFFYSHAYTMQYGEPFTHTGVLASYKLSDRLNVTAGITNGWDSFDNTNDRYNFLGGITYTSEDEQTSLAFAITTGDEDSAIGTDNVTMYSIVFTRQLTEKLSYVLHHDNGVQRHALLTPTGTQRAQWYGLHSLLFYELSDTLRAGLRTEWFRDDDGFRVLGDGVGVNYYAITAGLNWSFGDCLLLRPEVRWDWADSGARPYDGGTGGSQFLFATDLIYRF